MGILSAILSLLGLGTSITSSALQSQEQEKAQGKQQKYLDETEAATAEERERRQRDKKRKALAKAIGFDPLVYEREVEEPKKPDLTMSTTPGIVSGIGQGLGGLGSFLDSLPTSTATRGKKPEENEQVDFLYPGSDITRLT